MRGNAHVRFGGRAEETDEPKGPHRASVRPNHTHATLLLAEGLPLKVVSERLGHTTIAMTLDVYGHVLPAMDADAAERLDAILETGALEALNTPQHRPAGGSRVDALTPGEGFPRGRCQ